MGYASPERGGRALDLSHSDTSPLLVTGVIEHYPAGHEVPRHRHHRGHLLYATEGVLLVQADTGQWLVPPTTAVWLRPGVPHQLNATTAVNVHGLFIDEILAAQLPDHDCVIHVTPLVRELIAALVQVVPQANPPLRDTLLGQLLIEELRVLRPLPFHLPWPDEDLMRRICEDLVRSPAQQRTMDEVAQQYALTPKTLHRRFLKSTGMNLGKWRQQMRLMASIQFLLQGRSITQAALESGYESLSAYSVAFKKTFAYPPSEFLATLSRYPEQDMVPQSS
ncbi:AraC family transcriptional regulator [Alcaligenes parafaecalis]|uniref:Helix-turn-helix transcriptional regulator n=1 Tax=Alcaligenes parafaecalis TaxID=171260 RepID=A0ABT3VHN6_9BURK|nr:helix-turn-helix transcriptional regulator [Alcaligenes parafaecalis]MCX5463012.1 helix-turn-helix transcriptional regulator [Alcaligenes parafaecalis]